MTARATRSLAWIMSGACAVLLAALALLYIKSRDFDTSNYFEHVALLRQIKQLDARWELDALKSRLGINTNYDPLVSPLLDRVELGRQLDSMVQAREAGDASALRDSVAVFHATLDRKTSLIEQFKSHNAVLHNSTTFLPTAAQDILAAPGGAPLASKIDAILLDSLLFEKAASTERANDILAALATLNRPGLAPGVAGQVDLFAVHVRTVLREQAQVNTLLNTIATLPTGAHIDAIDNLLNQQQRRAAAQARVYRQYLLVFAAALLGLLLYLAARLLHSRAVIQRVNGALQLANDTLEQRVQQRSEQLKAAQAELLGSARRAGMAEIATNVLHNVGNVLNSVNVSAELVTRQLRSSRLLGLDKAVALLDAHRDDLAQFLTQDPKGRMLPGYLAALAEAATEERRSLSAELDRLTASVNHIKEIVATQQAYAGSASVLEPVELGALIEDAVRMSSSALLRHEVQVIRDYVPMPLVLLDKHQVLQILLNLINNAKQAVQAMPDQVHQITLRLGLADPDRIRIEVSDNGEGIAPDRLTRIFAHGYTTRAGGHGFGLHSCVLASEAMGGSLHAHSDGMGKGATLTLELPLALAEHPAPA